MRTNYQLPEEVSSVIDRIEKAGEEAWLVGSVRDLMLGIPPHDWDVTTSATPGQIRAIFEGVPMNLTGVRFGTVTLCPGKISVDVTTFRREGSYGDHRHPENVVFTKTLFEDLKRRDFTVNAIVFSPSRGVRDYFCGKRDLKCRLIRAIGTAEKRFEEDAIRILRALRFASVLGFTVEEKTRAAIHSKKDLLLTLPAERILPEFTRMICGRNVRYVLTEFADVIGVIVPEILPAIGFRQHSPAHAFDVWQHTVHAVAAGSPLPRVRLALFFHDLAKPGCLSLDENGRGHFYSHPKKSAKMAEEIMRRLKFPKGQMRDVVDLVTFHDAHPHNHADIKKILSELGEEKFHLLLLVMEADILAHSRWIIKSRLERLNAVRDMAQEILSSGECYSLKTLAVTGEDLKDIGLSGEEIGTVLNRALDQVIRGAWENDREAILQAVRCERA